MPGHLGFYSREQRDIEDAKDAGRAEVEKVINLQERIAEKDADRPVLVGTFADFLDEKAKSAWWPDDATYRQAAREIRRLEAKIAELEKR